MGGGVGGLGRLLSWTCWMVNRVGVGSGGECGWCGCVMVVVTKVGGCAVVGWWVGGRGDQGVCVSDRDMLEGE